MHGSNSQAGCMETFLVNDPTPTDQELRLVQKSTISLKNDVSQSLTG